MKYALCNELFGGMDLVRAAEIVKDSGYGGIEFAPYTVFGSFSPNDVQTGIGGIKKVLAETDLAFAGFHWLLVASKPMSLVSSDKALRDPALAQLRLLLDAAGELGGGPLILGSPKQRGSVPGQTVAEAKDVLLDGLASLGDYAVSNRSKILIEALDHNQCNVLNTIDEAKELIRAIASPGISGMFDFHNAGDETESWEALIGKHGDIIKHVHINEWDGGPPGTGSSDYAPAFKALKDIAYNGWISMEIFSQPDDPAAVVERACAFMRKIEEE
jgi:sugar phosphate isomerase/epimerase